MKVKDLIEKLQKMPQDTDVYIELRQSENDLDIAEIQQYKDCICLIANYRDFSIDEEEISFIEQELDEEARQDAIDRQIDTYLGK